jgi:hypothetical protein
MRWFRANDHSKKRMFFAVLHMGPVTGPEEAVRAAMVAERKAK